MNTFQIRPQIHLFDHVDEFLQEFPLTKKDLIFTSRRVYQNHLCGKCKHAHVIFHTDYGSGEPSDHFVNAILEDISLEDYDRIIAIGGGTILDVAKLLTLRTVQPVSDLFDQKIPAKKCRELLLVPTTCGTGSEVTNVSILEFVEKRSKFGLAVDALYADHAVLIPELLEQLPFSVFATSSIDAFVHAIESYISPRATIFSEVYSRLAMEMILRAYPQVLENGKKLTPELTKTFLVASCYAGIAFGNAGTGPVHAMSYPLSGGYHVAHGEANYVFLTTVFKKYQQLQPDGKIRQLNAFLADLLGCGTEGVYEEIERLFGLLIRKKRLSEYGVKPEELPDYALNVSTKQERLMRNKYTTLTYETILEMYRSLM